MGRVEIVVEQRSIDPRLPARWPRKPPKDARCDATTGTGADRQGKAHGLPVPAARCGDLEAAWGGRHARDLVVRTEHADTFVDRASRLSIASTASTRTQASCGVSPSPSGYAISRPDPLTRKIAT